MKKSFEVPQPLQDVYRDLRDRRLLIPAIALVVAILAVPVVLGRSAEPAPAPATAATADGATAVEPAVLVEQQSGLRSYKDRLAALKEKNPFEQKFALPTASQVGIDEPADPTADGEGVTTGTPPVATTPTEPLPPTSTGGDSTPDGVDDGVDEDDAAGQQPAPKPDPRFYAGRVDVKVGEPGDTKVRESISSLKVLPGENDPVVVFLGLGEGGNSAVFSVSTEVVSTSGEGNCSPKRPKPCRYLKLKVGEERRLVVGDEERQVRLKLLDTHIVRVPDPRD